MREFNRGSSRNFRDNRRDSRRDDRPMFDATCDECGKPCKLPFRPSNDKPVYCSECFETHGGDNRRNDRNDNRRGNNNFGGNRERHSNGGNDNLAGKIEELNAKLDKMFDLLVELKSSKSNNIVVEEAPAKKTKEVKKVKKETKKEEEKEEKPKKKATKKATKK